MSGKYLLDPNTIIALFANEVAVKSKLARADEVWLSNIAVGELCYGARRSRRSKENLERIEQLIANITVTIHHSSPLLVDDSNAVKRPKAKYSTTDDILLW